LEETFEKSLAHSHGLLAAQSSLGIAFFMYRSIKGTP
jgi:hypothetical protein